MLRHLARARGKPLIKSVRVFSTTHTIQNLFGGSKSINQIKLEPPSGKGESTANPADLFKKNDILMFSDKPINYIESVKENGFHLANNLLITSPDKLGNIIGTLLIQSETFEINLSNNGYQLINGFIINFSEEILNVFAKVHPKPEILVVGLGSKSRMLSESNKKFLSRLGIQLEVGDSSNAANIFDLLATERPNVIGALLLPPNV
ncbi:NADH dehydrogenase 1 alpha subcomplex assembly factor 3 [Scheffersomyces amazonensis]|uniref:NADH dehydrogenase 1 alpha subcomplex assembly factor 3 n=1 Tax=Scheffersomyces amazonensis TaxID=1078765 RepID=UPI00315C99FB